MRLAPVPMFYYPDIEAIEKYAGLSSRTTHGAIESIDACRLFSRILFRAFKGLSKDEILLGDRNNFDATGKILQIARGEYFNKDESIIRGTGYVVESLEAAFWCFYKTDNFKEAILMSANLGDDADTTSAICGQLAGAYYGLTAILESWLDKLYMRDEIFEIANRLYELACSKS